MGRIFITGDVHCPYDIYKLNSKNFSIGKLLTKDDYVIICGDAGFVWSGNKEDQWWIKWISEKPWTTLFVDGNHENFGLLNQYPVDLWNNGKVHKITNSLIHLMRGEIYDLYGLSFFCFGGGFSHDREYRKEGISWWQNELPTKEEIDNAMKNLQEHDYQVDYIITHDTSSKYLQYLQMKNNDMIGYDKQYYNINYFFDDIEKKVKFKKWYNGHYHIDREIMDRRFIFDDIIEIRIPLSHWL